MLPAGARLRRPADFAETLRHGRRAGRPCLVIATSNPPLNPPPTAPARVGFVVGRRVGGAVVRNRVRRRLRHLISARLADLPRGSRTVVRVLPGAERLDFPALAGELDLVLARVLR